MKRRNKEKGSREESEKNMKKIINNLLYDTDVSELIYHDEIKNRRWYKTPNSNYFVCYGTGEITPKTEESVREFLGQFEVDKYIALFGEPKEA